MDFKTLGPKDSTLLADLKEQAQLFPCQIVKSLAKLLKLLPHVFETPMHLWDQKSQKIQHRNPLKNGSLSENAMKEDERVLFQPFTERGIVEDCVAVILPPWLTL